jgi:hypothetical protein
VTSCLRAAHQRIGQTVRMDRETYIAPIVESYMPDASREKQVALTQELWALFDALYTVYLDTARFDSVGANMVESDSREKLISAPNP